MNIGNINELMNQQRPMPIKGYSKESVLLYANCKHYCKDLLNLQDVLDDLKHQVSAIKRTYDNFVDSYTYDQDELEEINYNCAVVNACKDKADALMAQIEMKLIELRAYIEKLPDCMPSEEG